MALYLVRHAVAVGRSTWSGNDGERPLTKRGHRQAAALARLLGASDVRRIRSSPALRCVDTVAPLARARGLEVAEDDVLAEGASARDAVDLVNRLAGRHGDSVLCTHGDLVPEVLRRLARQGMATESELQFAKGSTWELLVDGTRPVAGRYHPPAE
jgi:8-oxo-dGTP diphosphatase